MARKIETHYLYRQAVKFNLLGELNDIHTACRIENETNNAQFNTNRIARAIRGTLALCDELEASGPTQARVIQALSHAEEHEEQCRMAARVAYDVHQTARAAYDEAYKAAPTPSSLTN
tara:strand:+ start:513 stop:866 length:354 start_codon:yes stop_codon:yes gene_type:complete